MFAVQEVLYGVAEDFDGHILYTLDQLSSASIEVSSDPTEITDKNGNVIKQIYKNKTATFTATSALLSPAILNAGSGSKAITTASQVMPKIQVVEKNTVIDLDEAKYVVGSVKIVGIKNDGSNADAQIESELLASGAMAAGSTSGHMELTVPADCESYLVMFNRTIDGTTLVNKANKFPSTVRLTLYVAATLPCEDEPRACYVYFPSFQPDPSMTISLDSENQEVDYTGAIQVNYCDGVCDRDLYKIFFPEENAIVTAACEE